MRRIRYNEERETLSDHLVAALLSAIAMLLTISLGPIFASFSVGGGDFFAVYSGYGLVLIWGAALIVVAFVIGLVLGPRRMAHVWGHLWGTEQPERPWLSFALWLGVLSIVGVGYWAS
jgi:hypothetical protein